MQGASESFYPTNQYREGDTGAEHPMTRLFLLIRKNLKVNVRHKLSLPTWWRERRRVSNWLTLYLFTSSLLVQAGARALWGSSWFRRKALRVHRADGVVLDFPLWRYTRDPLSVLVYMYGSYMDRLRSLSSAVLEEGGVMIDIGAHVGTFAIPLLVHHPESRVVAIEPDPWNARCLRGGAAASGIAEDRITVIEAAVSNAAAASMEFVVGDTATRGTLAGSGFFREGTAHGRIRVETVTLAQVFNDHEIDRCALLKVDCEGCEYTLFEGLSQSVWDRIERIILEIHPMKDRSMEPLVGVIQDQGFRVEVDPQSNGCLELFCVRQDLAIGPEEPS